MNNIKMIYYEKNFLRKSAKTMRLPPKIYRAPSANLARNQREMSEKYQLFRIT
jgi:hypothetical protein